MQVSIKKELLYEIIRAGYEPSDFMNEAAKKLLDEKQKSKK